MAVGSASTGQGAETRKRSRRSGLIALALVTPALLLVFLIKGAPIIANFVVGFFNFRLTRQVPDAFIWFENYARMFESAAFWNALGRTGILSVSTISLQFILGFAVSLTLVKVGRLRHFLSGLILLPMMVPSVVAALTWMLLLDPNFGIVNHMLGSIGLPSQINWLGSSSTALLSVIIVETWRNTPFVVLILSAGLVMLPEEPFEAARIDGATRLQTFWHLTLPMMMPVITLVLVIRFMDTLRAFDTIYVLTKGGPGQATETASVHVYYSAFQHFNLGYGSVLAQTVFLVIVAISMFIIFASRRSQPFRLQ